MYPFKRFIQKMLYHNTNCMSLIPCGRLPCYCVLQQNIQKDETEYLRCYQTWRKYANKTDVKLTIK